MADNSILKDLLNGTLDMVVPHARKEPLNPMAYVKDVNEWFVPSAQMALDEAEGTAEYPDWAYGLASAPFIGKLAKPIAKVAGKAGKKVAEKTLKEGLEAESPIVREYAQNHVANVQKPSPEWTLIKEEPNASLQKFLDDESNYKSWKRVYMERGKSEEEASKLAKENVLTNLHNNIVNPDVSSLETQRLVELYDLLEKELNP